MSSKLFVLHLFIIFLTEFGRNKIILTKRKVFVGLNKCTFIDSIIFFFLLY